MTKRNTDTKATDNRVPFFLVEDAAIDKYDLDPFEGWLYVIIVKHADRKTGEAFPGIARLTKLAKMSRTKVMRCIKSLEQKGLIRVERDEKPVTGEKRQREVNHYYVLPLVGSVPQTLGVVSDVDYPSSPQTLGVVSDVDCNQNQLEPESINHISRKKRERRINPYFDAIKQVFGIEAGGWVGNLEAMMKGKAKRGEWQRCNFEPPVNDPQEILDFEPYLKRRMTEKHITEKPTACVTIQRWFYDYRAEKEKHAARKQAATPKTDYELIPILFLREMEQEQAAAARAAAEIEKVAS